MIPVRLVAQPMIADSAAAGARVMDDDRRGLHDGRDGLREMDLVLMQAGAQAIRVLHNRGDGSFEELDAAAMGLKASGHAVACAVAISTAMV